MLKQRTQMQKLLILTKQSNQQTLLWKLQHQKGMHLTKYTQV
jgi:hypothetical protein